MSVDRNEQTKINHKQIDEYRKIDVYIANRIIKKRKALEISCQSLAKTTSIQERLLSSYEEGSVRINSVHLFSIANALGVGIGYFYREIYK